MFKLIVLQLQYMYMYMLYHGLRPIMEQRNKIYTYTCYTQMMKLNLSTDMIKMTVMTKKAGDSGNDDDDV